MKVAMNDPKLNILIRTSGRPNYFNRLISTIVGQTYKQYRLIISCDDLKTEAYINKAGYTAQRVKKLFPSSSNTFPWNLYLNELIDSVNDGWILFIDDDDMYSHQMVFKMISDSLPDEDSMLVWKMRFPDGRLVPGEDFMGKTPFTRKQIAMPCFAFHSKWKHLARFDGDRAGDFRFINQLQKKLLVEWLDIPLVQLSNFGNVGKPVDLQDENTRDS